MQPQNKGPGMLWGQSYVLPMTWGGGGIWGAPFGRHAALRLFHLNMTLIGIINNSFFVCLYFQIIVGKQNVGGYEKSLGFLKHYPWWKSMEFTGTKVLLQLFATAQILNPLN